MASRTKEDSEVVVGWTSVDVVPMSLQCGDTSSYIFITLEAVSFFLRKIYVKVKDIH